MDWVGVLTAVGTVVVLWQLLKSEIKASEGRNGKAHDDIRTLIKASEDRNEKTHGELGRKIEEVGGKVDGVREDVAYMRGVMDGERNARTPRPAAGPTEGPGPAGD